MQPTPASAPSSPVVGGKGSRLVWADPAVLPETMIDYPAEGIRVWAASAGYSAHGW
jgi:hypothetical protein